MLVEWIKKYYELQKDFPSIIILYREGLSDEQAKMQGQKELQALFKVVERANKKKVGYNPQIIYVIVNKRVNSRFYMNGNKTERGSGKFRPLIENPSPGTIIFEPLST
jgi:ribosomal protein L23